MKNTAFEARRGKTGLAAKIGRTACAAAAALAVALPHAPLFAQDELFLFGEEPVIEVAAKRATRLEEAPGTVIVLTKEDIARMGAFTLGEALAYIVSSEMSPEAFTPGLAFRGIPSQFNNKILLMVDGRILNSVYRGNFFLDFPQPIDSVKRIEIIRGPGSSLYGANAFAGVINVVLLKPEDLAGAQGEMVGGTEETAGFHVAAGETFSSGRNFTLRGRWFDTQGRDIINPAQTSCFDPSTFALLPSCVDPFTLAFDPSGGVPLPPNNDHGDYYAAASWGKGKTLLSMGAQEFSSGWPGLPPLDGKPALAFPLNRKNEKRLYLDGQTAWKLKEKGNLSVRVYGDYRENAYDILLKDWFTATTLECPVAPCVGVVEDTDNDGNPDVPAVGQADCDGDGTPDGGSCDEAGNPIPFSDVFGHFYTYASLITQASDPLFAARINRQLSKEAFVVSEAIFEWDFSEKSRFLTGVNHKWDSIDNTDIGKHVRGNFALFLQQEWRPSEKWIFLVGGRYDYNTIYGSFPSPRANAVFLPSPHWTFKLGYGRAFRAPSFLELYENTSFESAQFAGNPALEPEKIHTYELQGQFRWGKETVGRLTATLFRYDIADEIGFLITGRNMYVIFQDPLTLSDVLYDCRLAEYAGVPNPVAGSWDCPATTDLFFPQTGAYANIAERVGEGAEFEARIPLGKFLTLGGNFSHTSITAPPSDDLLGEMETHDFQRANASVLLGGKHAHVGAWTRILGEEDASLFSQAEAYVDAAAGLHFKHLHFTVRVSNVFDKAPRNNDAYGVYWHPQRDLRAYLAFRKNL